MIETEAMPPKHTPMATLSTSTALSRSDAKRGYVYTAHRAPPAQRRPTISTCAKYVCALPSSGCLTCAVDGLDLPLQYPALGHQVFSIGWWRFLFAALLFAAKPIVLCKASCSQNHPNNV